MGLFDFLKSKPEPVQLTFPAQLGAAAKGCFVPMGQIPDEMFSTGILGVCCGIEPDEGTVYAPIDGKISQLTETRHAVGLECGGIDVLLHVGVDTVEMKGDGFFTTVREGQTVKKGDVLLTMDLGKIRAAGHPSTVIMAVTNSDDFSNIETVAQDRVQPGDCVLKVCK